MAIVTCPDCKRELSDCATSCPNCGYPYEKILNSYLQAKQLMEKAQSAEAMQGVAEMFSDIQGFKDSEELAEHCRKKATELPETGCQIVPNSVAEESSTPAPLYGNLLNFFGADKNIGKILTRKFSLAAIVAIALIAVVVVTSFGLGKNGKIALRDCKTLQRMCKVPSSFEVYEAIVYNDTDYGVCTYITYGAENSYGAKLQSVAIFADGEYLGKYGEERDDFDSQDEYDRFLLAHLQYQLYLIGGSDKEYAAKCKMKFVDTGKLMRRLKK